MWNELVDRLGYFGRIFLVGALVLSLGLELSGQETLVAIPKVARTSVIIYYIMRSERDHLPENYDLTRMCYYCCFGLTWTLVTAVIIVLVYLILDRVREHVDLDAITKGNHTQ